MAAHLCPQSHGRCDRRVPLGASWKSTSRPDVARVRIGDGLGTDRWSSLLPAHGTEPCRRRVNLGLRISNCGFDKQTNPSSCDSRKFLLDAKQSELRNSKSELLFMDKSELEQRTKLFALRIVQFVGTLPENKVTNVLDPSYSNPEPPLVRTIAKPIGRNLVMISFTRSE